MKGFVLVAGLCLVLGGAAQAAESPCCNPKPCPPGKTVVKGANPQEAKCCSTNATGQTTCQYVYAAGWACDNATADPTVVVGDNEVMSGCTEVSATTCTGGRTSTLTGCICVSGVCTQDDPAVCNSESVEGCCDGNACH